LLVVEVVVETTDLVVVQVDIEHQVMDQVLYKDLLYLDYLQTLLMTLPLEVVDLVRQMAEHVDHPQELIQVLIQEEQI
tara:strand:- start:520 stop:753 length:234 start_codon:yes stop_codon:yes gene_type:complete